MPGPMPVGPRPGGGAPVFPWSGGASASPAAGGAAPPAPAASTTFTPQSNVPAATAPYNYAGPSMNLLGLTDAPVGPAAPSPALSGGPPVLGGGALGGIFGGNGPGRGLRMFQ